MLRKILLLTILSLPALAFAQTTEQPATSEDQNQNVPVQMTQPPRVEDTTGTTATIAWSTNVQAGTRLIYGTDPNHLTGSASAPWGGVTHRVYLKDLQPNTSYFFQAFSEHASGTGTSVTSSVTQFRTASQ
jgi:phosphodiesterase/alkaline phosphatase D-like protein